MKRFILYNPISGNGQGESFKKKLSNMLVGCELIHLNIMEIKNYTTFFSQITESDEVYVCGGDGTLNRFINETSEIEYKNKIYYYAAGSGNDFMNDLEVTSYTKPIRIDEYISSLPTVTVKDKTYRFLNGVGLGVDGYVCSEISRKKALKKKKVSYVPVALKALFKDYSPTNATVTVDGVTNTYSRVWMSAVMKGRFFGGGMMIAPDQKRFDSEGKLTALVAYNLSKFKILSLFLLIFKGKHTKYVNHIAINRCSEVQVEFDSPCIIQIDGETIPDVSSYTVKIKNKEHIQV